MILASTAAFYLVCAGLLANPSEDVPYDGAVQVIRYGFEQEEDQNYDNFPDGWSRRKGPDFPNYVKAEIDRERGEGTSRGSLRIKVNGGAAALYAQPIYVDPLHAYVLHGHIRTQALENDAARISLSFLNDERQRVERYVSAPVTGTHSGWVEVTIGPISPRSDVRFLSVGCHLIPGRNRADIRGAVWFDDLWIGKVPQLSLSTNFQSHLRQPNSKSVVTARATGLDPQWSYTLDLAAYNVNDQSIATAVFPANAPAKSSSAESTAPAEDGANDQQPPEPIVWELPALPNGYYRVRALLKRDGVAILDKQTSFAVVGSTDDTSHGEFGWSVSHFDESISHEDFADAARQAGVNWVKFPLWDLADSDAPQGSRKISDLFETFHQNGIASVGLLNSPPPEIRRQFSRDWTGLQEVFSLPPSFWYPSIEKIVANFSSQVRYWQLGDDNDLSFTGMANLPQTLATVKSEFDRVGRDTQIGVAWDWQTPIPTRQTMPGTFVSVGTSSSVEASKLIENLKATADAGQPRWVNLKPLPKANYTSEQRCADLMRRMVAAKVGGADAIFAADVFDDEFGLLDRQCSPTLLYLPWRTTAMALRGSEFLGSIVLPGGSENYVFARRDEAMMVIWNKTEGEEELFLGPDAVITDVLGRTVSDIQRAGAGRSKIRVGPNPLIIRHLPEQIVRWGLAIRFEKGALPSKTGKQKEAILGWNTFPQGVSGEASLNVPSDWSVEPRRLQFKLGAGEKFTLPFTIELPSDTSLGTWLLWIDFEISGQPYPFRVYMPYRVGVGDVLMSVTDIRTPDNEIQIRQVITNNTSPLETLNFECSLFVPNQKRQLKKVTKLAKGKDTQVYLVPGADELRGQELLLRARQTGGQRVLNFRWKVGENWDNPDSSPVVEP